MPYGYSYRRRRPHDKKKIAYFTSLGVTALLGLFVIFAVKNNWLGSSSVETSSDAILSDSDSRPAQAASAKVSSELNDVNLRKSILAQAKSLSVMYDYDGAIKTITDHDGYENFEDLTNAILSYQETKNTLVSVDVTTVPHIFFHPLVYDSEKAFVTNDDPTSVSTLHSAMTTISEFKEILQELYDNDYVLVSLHDLMKPIKTVKGKKKLKKGQIYLPANKKPIIISEDDTNYYEKWKYKGVASRLICGTDGKPTNEVDMEDGSITTGDYDIAPVLEDFCTEHPDFSYKGARAVIAVTGYEGVFGFRTSSFHAGDHDANRKDGKNYNVKNTSFDANSPDALRVKATANCLRNCGFELASHSFVHQALNKCSDDFVMYDTKRFHYEVESLIGPVDIMLYPNGADIAEWYQAYNGIWRFEYMKKSGILYYCNVDGSTTADGKNLNATCQNPNTTGLQYFRSGRIALDGVVMYNGKDKLKKLFGLRVNKIWDKNRPDIEPDATYRG